MNWNDVVLLIQAGQRQFVIDALSSAQAHIVTGSWLSANNPYALDANAELKNDSGAGVATQPQELCEYIGASAIVHCFDGWSYLGRAIGAELAGDSTTSRHLAYYAELRGAKSLLAGSGIGVFKNPHAIITGNGQCAVFKHTSTHDFIWKAFDAWMNTPMSRQLVLDIIRPGGVPLSDWLRQFNAGGQAIVQNWLTQWGLDLQVLQDDHLNRNIASYEPSCFPVQNTRNIVENIASISEYWRLCEPLSQSYFYSLDRQLLRHALDEVGPSIFGNSGTVRYHNAIDGMLGQIQPGGVPSEWQSFLQNPAREVSVVINDANGRDLIHHKDHPRQVLARAFLLLRLATGSVKSLIESCGSINRSNTTFWWSKIGEARGFWEAGDPPDDFTDLWQDVSESLLDLDDACTKGSSANRIMRENGPSLLSIACAERIGLWAIGL